VAEKAAQAGYAWSSEERCLRTLLTNHGFTISVFVAVAITAMFAFIRSISRARCNPAGLGHSHRVRRIHLSFEFGAQAVTTTTLIQRVSRNESNCGQESCR
jgi:hypothetical protein